MMGVLGMIKKNQIKKTNMRKLTEKEIFMLEDQGCMAEEWSLIEVREDFKPNTIFNVSLCG